jgi:hypothetical protein
VAQPAAVAQPAGATATQVLPPHPGAAAPAPVHAVQAPVPTGPVDFVPGLPGLGTPPPPPAVASSAPPPVPATAPAAGAPTPTPTWPEPLGSDVPAQASPTKGHRIRSLRNRAALVGLGLVVLAVILLQLGLGLDFGSESYWSAVPLWSAFATVCALLGVAAFAAPSPDGDRVRSAPAWRAATGGLVGLAVFWLLVVLRVVDTDRGFVLTAALASLGGALWIGSRPKD